jgi:heme oxygenase
MTSEPVATNRSILARLKDETRPEHDAIEQVLDLMDGTLTLAAYRRRLEQFHGFYRPVEERLQVLGGWGKHGIDLGARSKVLLLEADLRVLGAEAVENLPVCWELPDLTDVVNGFGCLYVLEGSTLGSQFISRHVQKILGVTPEGGGRYFHGYGEQTGEMWREFGAALTAFAVERETQDRIVENAIATFRKLRGWFQRGHVS